MEGFAYVDKRKAGSLNNISLPLRPTDKDFAGRVLW